MSGVEPNARGLPFQRPPLARPTCNPRTGLTVSGELAAPARACRTVYRCAGQVPGHACRVYRIRSVQDDSPGRYEDLDPSDNTTDQGEEPAG